MLPVVPSFQRSAPRTRWNRTVSRADAHACYWDCPQGHELRITTSGGVRTEQATVPSSFRRMVCLLRARVPPWTNTRVNTFRASRDVNAPVTVYACSHTRGA
jgi:hypothetical protein